MLLWSLRLLTVILWWYFSAFCNGFHFPSASRAFKNRNEQSVDNCRSKVETAIVTAAPFFISSSNTMNCGQACGYSIDLRQATRLSSAVTDLSAPLTINDSSHAEPVQPIQGQFNYSGVDLLEQPDAFYIDKTEYILELESLGNSGKLPRAVLLMAPKRFSKSTTAKNIAHYYDVQINPKVEKRANELQLAAWMQPSPLKNKLYVMELDLSGELQVPYSWESFAVQFDDKLERQVATFLAKYGLAEKVHKVNDAVDYFMDAIAAVNSLEIDPQTGAKPQVLVIIDEYDTSTNSLLLHKNRMPKEQQDAFGQKLFPFIRFYAMLKKLCQKSQAFAYITGISPLSLTDALGGGFNIAMRPQEFSSSFAHMFGFTPEEMKQGIKHAGVKDEQLVERLLQWYTEQYHGYRFHEDDAIGVFNPNQAIFEFEILERFLKTSPNADAEQVMRHVTDPLRDRDANSLPTEPVLSMVVENILAEDSIISDVIAPGGVVSVENLTPWVNVDLLDSTRTTDTLCTFLYYHGMLTHAPPLNETTSDKRGDDDLREDQQSLLRLTAPNQVARQEVLAGMAKRFNLSSVSDLFRLKWGMSQWSRAIKATH